MDKERTKIGLSIKPITISNTYSGRRRIYEGKRKWRRHYRKKKNIHISIRGRPSNYSNTRKRSQKDVENFRKIPERKRIDFECGEGTGLADKKETKKIKWNWKEERIEEVGEFKYLGYIPL